MINLKSLAYAVATIFFLLILQACSNGTDASDPGPAISKTPNNFQQFSANASSGKITLHWQLLQQTSVTKIIICRDDNKYLSKDACTAAHQIYSSTNLSKTSYEDTNLVANKFYYYSIFAVTADERVALASSANALSNSDGIVADVLDVTHSSQDTQIVLQWRNPPGGNLDKIIIRRSKSPASAPSTANDGDEVFNGMASSYTDSNLVNGQTYHYTIFVKNVNGDYSSGIKVSDYPRDSTIPNPVANFTAANLSSTSLQLNWNLPGGTDFAVVKIFRSQLKSDLGTANGDTAYQGNSETFIDQSLTNGVTYYYTAFVIDTSGNWSIPQTMFITVVGDTTAPSIISILPAFGTNLVAIKNPLIRVNFSEPIDGTLVNSLISLVDASSNPVAGKTVFDPSLPNSISFVPDNATLALNTAYSATVSGKVKDLSGNPLGADQSWTFSTVDGEWQALPKILSNLDNSSAAQLSAFTPAVATNGQSTIAVWRENSNVYARFYHVNGGWDMLPTKLNTLATATMDPQVVMDNSGEVLVVWTQNNGGVQNLYAIHHSEVNGWDSQPALLQTPATSSEPASAARLAVDDGGTVIVTWLQQNSSLVNHVWARRLLKGDAWTNSSAQMMDADSGAVETSDVAMDAAGNAVVIWNQALSTGTGKFDLFYRRYDQQLGAWSANPLGPVDGDPQNDSRHVKISNAGSGGFFVVWSEAENWLAIRQYHFAGDNWDTLLTQNPDPSSNSKLDPQLASNRYGDAVVLWSDGPGLYVNAYSPTSGWRGQSKLASENVTQAALSMDAQGNALLLWRAGVALNGYRYQAKHAWNPSNIVPIYSELNHAPGNPAIATDSHGNSVAVWSYETDGIDGSKQFVAYAKQFQFQAAGPDLSVHLDSVTVSAAGNGSNDVVVKYTVSNLGDSDSGAFALDVWAGNNAYPQTGLRGNKTVSVSNLLAQQSMSFSTTVSSTSPNGIAFVVADAAGDIIEKNEADNVSKPRLWSLPANLVVSIDSVAVASVTNGNMNLAVSYTVTNNGYTPSGNFTIDLWANSASAPLSSSISDAQVAIAGLSPSQSLTNVVSITTSNLSGSAYAFVDKAGVTIESNKNDNISPAFAWQSPANLSLSINKVSVVDGNGGNNSVVIDFVVSNTGAQASGAFSVGLWANSAQIPVIGATPDTQLTIPSLAGGQSSSLQSVTLSTTMGAGSAYVLLDNTNSVVEFNEQDNLSNVINWQLPANLVVRIDSISATAATSGNDVAITYTVSNMGVTNSGAFAVDFWSNLAAPPVIGNTGEKSIANSGLAGGQSVTGVVVIASTLNAGSAYAVVDTQNAVAESIETDNITGASAWQLTTVTPPANLIVSVDNVITSANAAGGNNINITYTVTNIGSQASGAFNVDLWSHSASAPALTATGEVTLSLASLAANASITQTTSIVSNLSSGSAYALVDAANVVVESSDVDNLSTAFNWQLPANLVVKINSVGVTAINGSNDISVNYTVTNNGVKDSGAFNVDLWSNSSTPPAVGAVGDVSESHVSLAAGLSDSRTVVLKNPIASGTVYAVADSRAQVAESNETDNVSVGSAWTAPLPPPNLTVTIDSVSASISNGTRSVTINYTVNNNGGDVSGNFQVDIWDNLAAAPSLSQLSTNQIQHTSLAAGQSISKSVTLSSAVDTGTAYVSVDAPGVVSESNESDNISAGVGWQLPANLVATINSISALPGTAGNDVTINYSVSNLGATASGAFTVGLWSNSATAPSLGTTPEATANLASIAAGASVTNTVTLSNASGSGTAYIMVDTGNVVVESNELDNLVGKVWQLPANLSVVIDSVSAMPGATTNSVSVTFTVSNLGVANSGAFAVDLWSNLGAAPIVGNTGELQESFTDLVGGASVTRTSVLSSTLASGNAYAVVDSLQQVSESNENDNVSAASAWKFPPNLSVKIDSISVVPDATGNLVTINYTITNNGDTDASTFNVDFWVNAAAAPSVNSIGDITISKPSLAAGLSASGSVSIQTTLTAGTAYAYVDSSNVIVESNETDNASNASAWQQPANLSVVINSIDANSKNSLIVNYTVSNLGVAASGNYTTAIWANSASAPAAGAIGYDASESLTSLSQSGTDTRSLTLTTTQSSGTAYVSVDHGQTVSESNEGDNVVALAWQRPANLTVTITAVNVTTTATGNNVVISYTVQNTGGTAAAQFELGFWADSATAPVIGTSVANSTALYAGLAAGGVISDSVTLASTATGGTAYVSVDNASVIAEYDETDNVSNAVAWTEPVVAQPPNLTVTIDSVSVAVAASSGYDVTINYTVSNTGLGQSGGFTLDLWSDAASAPAVGAAGEVQVSHANLLAQTSLSSSVIINSSLTSGTAYAVVDTGALVAESDETDNVSLGSAWTVPAGNLPNIAITLDSVSAVASATAGQYDITLSYTVKNTGVDPSGDFNVGLWSDYSTVPDTSAVPQSKLLQTSLAGAASAKKTITLQNTVASGTAYVYADIDAVVTEFNESDNASLGVAWTPATVSQADLSVVINSVTAVPAATSGTDVTINYTVSNNDVVASGDFSVALWSAATAAPALGDVGDATASLTSLAGGSSVSQSITLNSALTYGMAYAIVDPSNSIVESNETNNASAGAAWVGTSTVTFDFEDGLFPSIFDTPTWATGAWSGDPTDSGPSLPGGSISFISPVITANQSTCFHVSLDNVQNIQFDVRSDSEANYDAVYFFIDVVDPGPTNYAAKWSGNIAWQTWSSSSLATPLVKGTHSFEWCYNKDASVSVGADRAWVDNIIVN